MFEDLKQLADKAYQLKGAVKADYVKLSDCEEELKAMKEKLDAEVAPFMPPEVREEELKRDFLEWVYA